MSKVDNPFLSNIFPPDFSAMTPRAAGEAVTEALAEARANVKRIEDLEEGELTYENTIRALDNASNALDDAWTMANHLESVNSSPEMRELVNARDAEVTDFHSSIPLNEKLWKNVKAYADRREKLDHPQSRLLEETVLGFVQNGANLPAEDKRRLMEVDAKLSALTRKFAENALDAQNAYELHVSDKGDLKGLPGAALGLAAKKAGEKGLDGWLITLDAPIFMPLMSHCENEALRKKVWTAYSELCDGGEFDNGAAMREIVGLRAKKAEILGHKNFADYVLEDRMAKNGATAVKFVEGLREKFLPAFEREIDEIQKFAGVEKLDPWNSAFVAENMRKKFYDFDGELLRPYFPLDRALEGAFGLARTLFGLKIEKSDAQSWHESVMRFDVFDEGGARIAQFHADLFPRKGKRAGAWMNLLKDSAGGAPKLGLVAANFNEPTKDAPALLSHDELATLFHEFGHLIHFMLMDAPERGLRDVAWDFVELPSQIMENWCDRLDFLDTFAAHWKTGEKIPRELFAKFDAAKKFRGASGAMRQLAFSKIDLELHTRPEEFAGADIEKKAREILRPYSQEYTQTPHTILHHFTHIFADPVGYAAGYYSYKWAEALDADAFTRFEREGIMNPKTGRDFADKILRPGKTVPEAQAFKNFMGRDPDPEALVRRTI